MTELIEKSLQHNQDIVGAIEASLFEYSFYLSEVQRSQRHQGEDVNWSSTGGPVLNRIFGARLRSGEIDDRIEELAQNFRLTKTPVTWLTGPSTQPSNLGQRLQKHGFTFRGSWAGMGLDLDRLNQSISTPPRLTIKEVTDTETLDLWVQVACSGFQFPGSISRAYRKLLSGLHLDSDNRWRQYLGLVDGEPVATCTLFTGAGVAGIYWTATVADSRRHGVATALVHHLLRQAQYEGYRTAVLHSTQMGLPLYQRLGFEEYCKIGIYTWKPNPSLLEISEAVMRRLHLTRPGLSRRKAV